MAAIALTVSAFSANAALVFSHTFEDGVTRKVVQNDAGVSYALYNPFEQLTGGAILANISAFTDWNISSSMSPFLGALASWTGNDWTPTAFENSFVDNYNLAGRGYKDLAVTNSQFSFLTSMLGWNYWDNDDYIVSWGWSPLANSNFVKTHDVNGQKYMSMTDNVHFAQNLINLNVVSDISVLIQTDALVAPTTPPPPSVDAPASALLLSFGLAGLLVTRRRQTAKKS